MGGSTAHQVGRKHWTPRWEEAWTCLGEGRPGVGMQTGCMVGLRPAVGGSTRPSANFQIHPPNADGAD